MNTSNRKAGLQIFLLLAIVLFSFGPYGLSSVQAAETCFVLTLTSTIGGTAGVTPGTDCLNSLSQPGYTSGTIITVTATPNATYGFWKWDVSPGAPNGASTDNPNTITMDSNNTVIANFSLKPTNDDFANAKTIDKITYEDLNVNTTGATTQVGVDPDNVGPCDNNLYYNTGNKTVWYTYTNDTVPATTESIAIDTKDSTPAAEYDTFVSVWVDNSGTLDFVGCNDDGVNGYSEMIFIAETGKTYYIQVADQNGTVGGSLGGNIGGLLQFHAYIRNVEVRIGNSLMGTYYIGSGQSRREFYDVDSGPVKIHNFAGQPITAALLDVWLQRGTNIVTSYAQFMGLPKEKLSTTYYFPSYNNRTLSGQLRFSNVGTAATKVRVYIGGIERGNYVLQPNEQRREFYDLDTGPVVVSSEPVQAGDPASQPIIAALLDVWLAKSDIYDGGKLLVKTGTVSSYSQMMGFPELLLSDTYFFPSYNNRTLSGQLRFGVP